MPTHYKGNAQEVRALNTMIKLSRASESLASLVLKDLGRDGLTPGQFGVLETLLHLGDMCQSELGRKHLRSNPNMTAVLDNLEKRGLARRQRQSQDRRKVLISLTPKGRELIADIFPAYARRIAEALAPLEKQEQEDLGRLCKKLGLALAARPGR